MIRKLQTSPSLPDYVIPVLTGTGGQAGNSGKTMLQRSLGNATIIGKVSV